MKHFNDYPISVLVSGKVNGAVASFRHSSVIQLEKINGSSGLLVTVNKTGNNSNKCGSLAMKSFTAEVAVISKQLITLSEFT